MQSVVTAAAEANTGGGVDELKKLPIAYVLEQAGHHLVAKGDVYACPCPFHEDSDPSFDVFGEHLEKWGCFPCGIGGDVLDLIGRLHGASTFGEQAKLARLLQDQMVTDGWTGPTVGVTKTLDMDAVRSRITNAGVAQTGSVAQFLDSKLSHSPGLVMSPDWLKEVFRVGDEAAGRIVIPYLDRAGQIVTMKHRTPHTKALSVSGSSFGEVLYGEWLDTDSDKTVVLCEGETDTWAAAYALLDQPYVALGLPTGAGAQPKQAVLLVGRKVILAFDGDEAGRKAIRRWHSALSTAGAAEVSIAPMPDGYDLAKMVPADLRATIAKARPTPLAPSGLRAEATGYVRPGKEENMPISNWTFDPDRELVAFSGTAYEGTVRPSGVRSTVSSFDLSSRTRTVAWAAKHGGSWYGADRDAQLLLGNLQAAGPFLATGKMDSVAGLHEGHFIWPGGRIGPDYWVYVPPASDVHLENYIHITNGWWDTKMVHWLRALHLRSVMDPILAWLAIAPLRSLLREFPILAVTGSSGSGKTTLLETVVDAFTSTFISTNLTSTTKHALFALTGATNAFPIHFDEYRPGARKDAIETINQILRDAYTSQASAKGGMGEGWAEVTSIKAEAPIIISGEDAFHETSHTERMVQVTLPLAGKNVDALNQVKAWGRSGLAHAYLTWLHDRLRDGSLPAIVNTSVGQADLPARARLNLGVLTLGWHLLELFITDHAGYTLGDPDWSLITHEAQQSATKNPVKDSILWALDETDAAEFAVQRNGFVYIRVENFVTHVSRHSTFQLPGGTEAMRRYLVEHYGAKPERASLSGKQVRVLAFPLSALG